MPWLLVLLSACHGGGGPVVAFTSHGARRGVEASGGWGPVGGRVGATAGTGPGRVYASFDPAAMLPLTPHKDGLEGFLGFGGSLGLAAGADDIGLAAGGWVSPFLWDDRDTCETQDVYSVTIGWRTLDGVREIFVAPKVNVLAGCAP